MTEKDYIDISNRIKIQTAQGLLRDVLIMDGDLILDERQMKMIQNQLSLWTDRLFDKVKIKV